ncbi:MAG: DMT family protein [Bdellovibrionaceae bacterium]|nr:DMT family protein [Pseudobdellovibrionaceae bacterium]
MTGPLTTIGLLLLSNVFMTFAWYGHLKNHRGSALGIVILASWGIAFFEYCLQVPANRIGAQHFDLAQLKVMQEIITMLVFAVFMTLYMKQSLRWDLLWAGLCLVGAAYFIFRDSSAA